MTNKTIIDMFSGRAANDALSRMMGDTVRMTQLPHSILEDYKSLVFTMSAASTAALSSIQSEHSGVWSLATDLRSQLRDFEQGVVEPSRSIAEAVRTLTETYRSALAGDFGAAASALESLSKPMPFDFAPSLEMLRLDLLREVKAGELSGALRVGSGSAMFDHLASIEESQDEEELAAAVESIIFWLLEQARSIGGRLTWKTIGRVIAFIVNVYMLQMTVESTQGDRRHDEQHARILLKLEQVEDELGRIEAREGQHALKVVAQDAEVRKIPSTEAEVLQVLPPELPVQIIEEIDGWVLVEYCDIGQGGLRKGWLSSHVIVDEHPSPVDICAG